ncbi:hypothetical protein Q3G72_013328 [Acer saccharum]|nr:hypothetical protein Q3G72_013328 [Acer saccharum]
MMDIAGDYALAETEEVAQRGSYVHGHKPDTKLKSKDDKTKTRSCDCKQKDILFMVEDKGLTKYPRQQSANARKDMTKYYRFHKDKHSGRQDSYRGNRQERKCLRKSDPIAAINTIFDGSHTGRSNRERISEVREMMYESRNIEVNSVQRSPKRGREGEDPITFMVKDSEGIIVKPNDAIVVGVQIAHKDVLRV